ncbi:phage tail protein [Granulicella sp. 5B5]|uniref:phage tail protein n=1 Tax=Granulicella sp. 5B5 TaxID=1617967 RepID=UPI0015F45C3B|nr:tail fiber protein [Granulicella sp. 5B5]QMV19927.1 phage tail protein [Granulicella sp. 5B5]
MSDPYLGEIRMVSFQYAPYGWALCNGQTLPVAQNQALFSLLGVTYGGNGTTNFNLPDLQGRIPLHAGAGPGLPPYDIGQKGGVESMALTTAQLPPHTHAATFTPSGGGGTPTVNVSIQAGNQTAQASAPSTPYLAAGSAPSHVAASQPLYASSAGTNPHSLGGVSASISGLSPGGGTVTNSLTGNGQPFSIEPPYLAVYFIIALQGVFPTRG